MNNKVINIDRSKRKELLSKVNRLNLIKAKLPNLYRFEVEDMIYRLNIGSPIDLASEIFIIKLYETHFK